MAKLLTIERNYFGVTIYVATRNGHEYACKVLASEDLPTGGLRVEVQSWPGYGHYQGHVELSKHEKSTLLKAYELSV